MFKIIKIFYIIIHKFNKIIRNYFTMLIQNFIYNFKYNSNINILIGSSIF